MPELSEEKDHQSWVDDCKASTMFGTGSNDYFMNSTSTVTEIEEEVLTDSSYIHDHDEPFNIVKQQRIPGTIREGSDVEPDAGRSGEEDIYIAVGKSNSSMDALKWALKQALKPSTVVYLIHVFPEVRHIPTPLGKFSKEQLSPDQVENYMNQERSKRRQLLQKFLDVCTTSQVIVDTLLIESDNVAKAVIDLIPILNIRKLVAGTTKSNLRKFRKGSGIAEQILKNAPEACEVKIICEGKQVMNIDQTLSPRGVVNMGDNIIDQEGGQTEDSISSTCVCFARKFM